MQKHLETPHVLPVFYDLTHNHATWIEISRKAFQHNIYLCKQIIGDQRAIGVVIKSNGYGHGLKEIGSLCQEHLDVKWIYTATLTEALLLRSFGITKPILVLATIDNDYTTAVINNIRLTVYEMTLVAKLNEVGKSLEKKVVVHLKIDTGLSRFGWKPFDFLTIIEEIIKYPYIKIEGIFTHFSESGNRDPSFSLEQLALFETLLQKLQQKKIFIPLRHSANTAGIMRSFFSSTNLVRLGIGAYGVWPSYSTRTALQKIDNKFSLQQVLEWKARILLIRSLPSGSPIGYDRTYYTIKPTKIALIAVGYYEGYDRRFSNKAMVGIATKEGYIKGYAPVLGTVCMNVTLVDVTHIKTITLHDVALLSSNLKQICINALSDYAGMNNPRELMARINAGIKKTII